MADKIIMEQVDVSRREAAAVELCKGEIPGARPVHHTIPAGQTLKLVGNCGYYHILILIQGKASFTTADRILKEADCDVVLVDFHAEATSEKGAMAWYLDGRVQAVWGTHTHVPTADQRVFPKGTGYVTDLGMSGPIESVLGIRPEQSMEFFLGGLPGRYQAADGPCSAQGCIFTLNGDTGLCTGVERIEIK